jgi:hypothetical protein
VANKKAPAAAIAQGKTPRVMRLLTINSDESKVAAPTRVVALAHPDTGFMLDGVTATVALLEPGEYEALEKKHRTIPDKASGKLEWKLDAKSLVLEILTRTVKSWTGVAAADGKPLAPSPVALNALDDTNKLHLTGVARTPADVVDAEVVDASFR